MLMSGCRVARARIERWPMPSSAPDTCDSSHTIQPCGLIISAVTDSMGCQTLTLTCSYCEVAYRVRCSIDGHRGSRTLNPPEAAPPTAPTTHMLLRWLRSVSSTLGWSRHDTR